MKTYFRKVFFATALLVATLVPAAMGVACHEMESCGACRNTTLCHWCEDQQCHAIGSISG